MRFVDRSLPAGFGRANQIVHFTGRHVMKVEIRVTSSQSIQILVKADHGIAEKDLLVPFGGADECAV